MRCGRSVGRHLGRSGCGLGGGGGRGRRIVCNCSVRLGCLAIVYGLGEGKGERGVLLDLGCCGGWRDVEDFIVVLFEGSR